MTIHFHMAGYFPGLPVGDDGTVRYPVLYTKEVESFELDVDFLLFLDDLYTPYSVKQIFIRDDESNKMILRRRKDRTQALGWRWVEITLKDHIKPILVKNPDKCGKCDGKGEINWGNVTSLDPFGIPRRKCWACHGSGFDPYNKENNK